jgi:hypothetical protein
MALYYVLCIVKQPDHDDPYTAIQEYGLATAPGATVPTERWSQDRMIAVLEDKEHKVKCMGRKPGSKELEFPELEVVPRNGKKYVKTKNDGDEPDNLLRRPECKAGIGTLIE